MSKVTKLTDKALRETMRSLYNVLIKEPENKDKFVEFCQIYENHKSRKSFFANLSFESSDYSLYEDVAKKNSRLAKFLALNGISSERIWNMSTLIFIMDLPKDEFLSNEVMSFFKTFIQQPKERIDDLEYFAELLKIKILDEVYKELDDDQKVIKFLELIGDSISVFLEELPSLFLLDPKMGEIIINKLKTGEIKITEKLLSKCLYSSAKISCDFNEIFVSILDIAIEKGDLAKFSDAVKVATMRPDLFNLCDNHQKLSVHKWMKIFSHYEEAIYKKDYSEEMKMSIKRVFSCFNLYMLRALPNNLRTIGRLVKEGYIEVGDVIRAEEPEFIDYTKYNLNELTVLEFLLIVKKNITNVTTKSVGLTTSVYINDGNEVEVLLSSSYIRSLDDDVEDLNWKLYFLSNFFEFSKNEEFTKTILSKISLESAYHLVMLNDSNVELKSLILKLIDDKKIS